jgi:hypothetical protein
MSVDAGLVTLVAMPRSAETFLVRDASGTLWLVPPAGAGTARPVDDSAIDEAVRKHDWDRIDATFDSWEALDADRRVRAAALAPGRDIGIDDYDATDVQRIIRGARARYQAGDVAAARTMLHRLQREVRLVRQDTDLYDEIANLLAESDAASPRPPRRDVTGVRAEYRSRAQRLNLISA